MPEITSRQHSIVKAFRAVADGDDERAVIDGWHLLHEARAAGLAVEAVAFSGTPRPVDTGLIEDLRAGDTRVLSVSADVLDALSPVRTPTGVVAVIRKPQAELAQLLVPTPPLVIVAIDVQDPGNVGAIIRSAEAGGATGVVCAGASANPWRSKALRAAMGSSFRLPVLQHADTRTVCDTLRGAGLIVCATAPGPGISMHDADLAGATALLFGGEGAGLSPSIIGQTDMRLTIPMRSPVESLNVAVAVGVLVYEARRQRTMKSAV